MNLGTHGMAVQGYIALHNGTYQNPELLMNLEVAPQNWHCSNHV